MNEPASTLPAADTTPMAFKEWSLVCEAMGRGFSSLFLRKGGIAEGREGFSFKHRSFWLFPTFFHAQLGSLCLPPGWHPEPPPTGDQDRADLRIRWRAEIAWTTVVTDESLLPELAPWHLWNEEVVRERFHYEDAPGIHLAYARISALPADWVIPWERGFGGCRSWVSLPDQGSAEHLPLLRPCRAEEEWERDSLALRALLGL
jgi:hypothetical protein